MSSQAIVGNDPRLLRAKSGRSLGIAARDFIADVILLTILASLPVILNSSLKEPLAANNGLSLSTAESVSPMYTTPYPWPDTIPGLTPTTIAAGTGSPLKPESLDNKWDGFEDFTLPEMMALQEEDQLACQELRQKNREMINKRLTKEISSEEFVGYLSKTAEWQTFLHGRHQRLGAEFQRRAPVRHGKTTKRNPSLKNNSNAKSVPFPLA